MSAPRPGHVSRAANGGAPECGNGSVWLPGPARGTRPSRRAELRAGGPCAGRAGQGAGSGVTRRPLGHRSPDSSFSTKKSQPRTGHRGPGGRNWDNDALSHLNAACSFTRGTCSPRGRPGPGGAERTAPRVPRHRDYNSRRAPRRHRDYNSQRAPRRHRDYSSRRAPRRQPAPAGREAAALAEGSPPRGARTPARTPARSPPRRLPAPPRPPSKRTPRGSCRGGIAGFKSPIPSPRSCQPDGTQEEALQCEIKELRQKDLALDQEIAQLLSDGYSLEELEKHISLLHEYNDIKDAGQMLLGQLAVIRGVTTKQLYPEYDLELSD
ncbi:DNA repair protein SWI5 homolog [Apus apus]|uniref:DNA repair protein SWI5 homolog n=1 Tax=Apus apus TaxID=8895 RepID=UPI0021F9187F|nr:DNA repair protein SWI5 homolog [Apus apus]